jgi:hypothetical protein
MDIDSGKLYTPEEVARMSKEERAKLKWINRQEMDAMIALPESDRPRALREMRAREKKAKRYKRMAQKKARKKNR